MWQGKKVRMTADMALLGLQAQGSVPWRTEPGVTYVNIGLFSPPHPFLLEQNLEFAVQCRKDCHQPSQLQELYLVTNFFCFFGS